MFCAQGLDIQVRRLYAVCTCCAQGLDIKVWRDYDEFVEELSARFPAEREGIKKFYGECWSVFNALNSLDLKSLEEPRYLLGGGFLLSLWGRESTQGR